MIPYVTHKNAGQLFAICGEGRPNYVRVERLLNGKVRMVRRSRLVTLPSPLEVTLYHNDESGKSIFTLIEPNNPGLWLESFDTETEAHDFCAKHGIIPTGLEEGVLV